MGDRAPEPRTLEALGLAGVPARDPLSYPGRPVDAPALLNGDELLPLRARQGPPGDWPVEPEGDALDDWLTRHGRPDTGRRRPVIAVGSNASPGQLRYKLTRVGLPVAVPMVPVAVTGLAAGVSAHISAFGYLSASPYLVPGPASTLVVSWLDPDQLAAVDATERFNYRRVRLDGGAFPMLLPSGARLPSADVYVNVHGVLALDGRTPRPAGEQRALLGELLAASGALRELFGPGPEDWARRAREDPTARAAGARAFAAAGWVLRQRALLSLGEPERRR